MAALGLPSRSTWPAPRQPPAAPPPAPLRLWGKDDSNLPAATVHRGGSLGYNVGRSVLRVPHDRRWELAWLGMALGLFGAIPLAIAGHAGAMLGIMGGAWVAGFSIGRRVRRETCSDPSCGVTLAPALPRCSRCGGDIAGTLQRGENRLEAEERLGINQADYDLDVGEPSESGVGLPTARVRGNAERHARVDAGGTDTSV